jgi:hypothetical protein
MRTISPSSKQSIREAELLPKDTLELTENIDPIDELLLVSVEELGFSDETELPPEDVSLPVTELEEIVSSPLEDETSATGSGPAPLELSSQATIAITVIKTTQK